MAGLESGVEESMTGSAIEFGSTLELTEVDTKPAKSAQAPLMKSTR